MNVRFARDQVVLTEIAANLWASWFKGPGKRGHIVAHDVSWAAQTGKHLLRTQNVSEQNQKNFLCPQQKQRARGNICVGNNVSSFARALKQTISSQFFLLLSWEVQQNTLWLAPWETVSFVSPRPQCFPRSQSLSACLFTRAIDIRSP